MKERIRKHDDEHRPIKIRTGAAPTVSTRFVHWGPQCEPREHSYRDGFCQRCGEPFKIRSTLGKPE